MAIENKDVLVMPNIANNGLLVDPRLMMLLRTTKLFEASFASYELGNGCEESCRELYSRRPTYGCGEIGTRYMYPQLMVGRHVFNTGRSGQAMAMPFINMHLLKVKS